MPDERERDIKRRIRVLQEQLTRRSIDVELLDKPRRVRILRVRLTEAELMGLKLYAAKNHTTASKLVRSAIQAILKTDAPNRGGPAGNVATF